MKMFPKVVIEDLKHLCKTIGEFRRILPTESDIIEAEFRHEINAMKKEPIERAIGRERYQEFRVGDRVCRKHLIHGTKKESELTGADLAVEVEGQKLVFFQAKREGTYHRFQFDRRQMLHLMWLNDEIIEKQFPHLPFFPLFPHRLSYRVPCFYKLIFLKVPFTRPIRHGQIQIEEEMYVPVKHVDIILGRRKSAASSELRTGYTPSEFQTALEKCEVGSSDLEDEDLKKKLFFDYSKLTNRLVVHLSVR